VKTKPFEPAGDTINTKDFHKGDWFVGFGIIKGFEGKGLHTRLIYEDKRGKTDTCSIGPRGLHSFHIKRYSDEEKARLDVSYFEDQKEIPEDIEREEFDQEKRKQPQGQGKDGEEGEHEHDEGEYPDCTCEEDDNSFHGPTHAEDCPCNDSDEHDADKHPSGGQGEGEGDSEGDGEGEGGGPPEDFDVIDVFDARRFAAFMFTAREKMNADWKAWPTIKGCTCTLHPYGDVKDAIHTGCGILLALKGRDSGKVSIVQSDVNTAPKLPGWKPEWKFNDIGTIQVPTVDDPYKHVGDKFVVVAVLDCAPLIEWQDKYVKKGEGGWARPEAPVHVLYTGGYGDAELIAGLFQKKIGRGGWYVTDREDVLIRVRVDGELSDRCVIVDRKWLTKNYPEWRLSSEPA
jgi:hypothetical protein